MFIIAYLIRCIKDYAYLPLAVLSNITFLLYNPKQIKQNYDEALASVNKKYDDKLKNAAATAESYD